MAPDVQHLRLPGGRLLPVLELEGGRPGPRVAITANLHGDECTGLGVVFDLARRLPLLGFAGQVALYPSLNPTGLASGTRHIPGDEVDPNRAWPGGTHGGLAAQQALAIWDHLLARRPALLIDLHTDSTLALPYALVDRVIRGPRGLEDRCAALAAASGLLVLREYPAAQYVRYGLDQSLPGALVNGPGVAAVTLELGPRRLIAPDAVREAVTATLGVLSAAGLLDAPAPPHPSRPEGGPWRRENGPKARGTGVLLPLRAPGERIAEGDPLARLMALDGSVLQTLTCPRDGLLISVPERAWVTPGTICATLAVPED